MKNKYIKLTPVIILAAIMLTSCYKTFDPSTYAPKFTINGFSSVDQIQADKLQAYWAFQNSLVDSVSLTSASNSGTTYANGFIGQALNLNVSNSSYAEFEPTAAIKGLQSFTISFWVNPTFVDSDSDGGIDGILGFVNIANLTDFWGYLDWFIENGSNPTSATLKIHFRGTPDSDTWIVKSGVTGLFGTWSNHTLTFDAATSTITYYMNGSVLATATAPWTGPVNFSGIGPLVFGCMQFQTNPSLGTAGGAQSWASYLTGSLDEIRIYNTALSAAEVNSLVVLQGKMGK